MDALKAMLKAKKEEQAAEFGGKKFIKRAELEEQRLKRLREEEETERKAKEAKRQQEEDASSSRPASRAAARPDSRAAAAPAVPTLESLTREEVIRRLRKLKEPTTLFGESNEARFARMLAAEAAAAQEAVEEEAVGGQQENLHIRLAREAREAKARQLAAAEAKRKAAAVAASSKGKEGAGGAGEGAADGGEAEPADPEQAGLMAAFQQAAEAVAEARMPPEDRIAKWLRRWMADWEQDLEARPEEVKATPAGLQADMRYKETVQYMKPLFAQLKHRDMDPELLAGLKLMVDAIRDRNYLHANKIYLGIAIGNAAWPIGVTQVGLHERAAREKISFKGNEGKAHIMNDEATRKWIQGLKRLTTFCQRRYPTDPSRSMDFDGHADAGSGAFGGGGDKVALLTAAAAGDTLAPAPAPTVIDQRGAVKIPQKWSAVLREAQRELERAEAVAAAAAAAGGASQQQQQQGGKT